MVEVFLQYRIRGPPTSVNLIDTKAARERFAPFPRLDGGVV